MNIYVASSWRNAYQPDVVLHLRNHGYEAYDFRHPVAGDTGFHWSEIDANWAEWDLPAYLDGLGHLLAEVGFGADMEAMRAADACVLVLPCGRSAHLEAGWFVGQGKPLIILLIGKPEPELMYKMADAVCGGDTLHSAIHTLGKCLAKVTQDPQE